MTLSAAQASFAALSVSFAFASGFLLSMAGPLSLRRKRGFRDEYLGGMGFSLREPFRGGFSEFVACLLVISSVGAEGSLLQGKGVASKNEERLLDSARKAGLEGAVNVVGFRKARFVACFAFALAGLVVGALFSMELAVLLCAAGTVGGTVVVSRSIRSLGKARADQMERHLSEMLEVLALGMRSGLSFDGALDAYVGHFDTLPARAFGVARRAWATGLATREEALRSVAASCDSALLSRVVDDMIRSLRFGSSMAESFVRTARRTRSEYKACRQERVAKAPVKMLLPIGALMIPAMLIMVLGPVLLDLAEGF